MKLSDLIKKLEKAIVKYGDIPVVALGYEDANSLSEIDDAWKIMDMRIMVDPQGLPGMSIEGDEPAKDDSFAVIFYDNRF